MKKTCCRPAPNKVILKPRSWGSIVPYAWALSVDASSVILVKLQLLVSLLIIKSTI